MPASRLFNSAYVLGKAGSLMALSDDALAKPITAEVCICCGFRRQALLGGVGGERREGGALVVWGSWRNLIFFIPLLGHRGNFARPLLLPFPPALFL